MRALVTLILLCMAALGRARCPFAALTGGRALLATRRGGSGGGGGWVLLICRLPAIGCCCMDT